MCGIFCEITPDNGQSNCSKVWPKVKDLIIARGPDYFTNDVVVIEDCNVELGSSVLWLRGLAIQKQPVFQNSSNILIWNGDVFGGELDIGKDDCDTNVVLEALSHLGDEEIPAFFSTIQGPFAFVFIRKSTKKLWFGRDFFGRHSLLLGRCSERSSLFLTSVGTRELDNLVEVPALGVFEMELCNSSCDAPHQVVLHPWCNVEENPVNNLLEICVLSSTKPLPSPVILPPVVNNFDDQVDELLPQEVSPLKSFSSSHNETVVKFQTVLESAVRKRTENQPHLCKQCVKTSLNHGKTISSINCRHSKVGVLFSGGLDSSVIASLADKIIEPGDPIELLNVAFEHAENGYDVPDRLTARQAFQELQAVNPNRKFIFIEINVSKEQLVKARDLRIRDLLYPHETVLDDSIGCALWFAASASSPSWSSVNQSSSSRVLLLGMGADEQLGGYSRHRMKYSKGGISALSEELRMEVSRISRRNMGRDNRILGDHGIAPRYPYLDEELVSFLSQLNINQKLNLKYSRGIGEKILLRCLAAKLGLVKTASEPKRAIQFGSRIAKMENRKEKGSDMAVRD